MKFNCLSSLVSCNAFFQLLFRAMCQAHIQLQILQRASAILLCPTSHHLLATLTCIPPLVTYGGCGFLSRWVWFPFSYKFPAQVRVGGGHGLHTLPSYKGNGIAVCKLQGHKEVINVYQIPGYRSQLLLPNSLARLVSACYWRGL